MTDIAMPMEKIITVEQAQTLYDASNKIIKMTFIGDMSDDSYKAFWTKSIDFAEKQQVNRIIIDQRQIGNVSFNARGWVVISAFPRVKKVLPNNMAAAILGSEKIMQKTGMQYLLKAFRTLTGYTVEILPDQEEAVAFLRKVNNLVKVPA
ncbi:hypothetical protein [Cesiribacter sp. SM1]|uniref:hypothetical protein n=1 Tax=Cesiribacter sp. SM1 TaxID=2861196 RepID=UPI001CD1F997|nr:hypothetical protein [Cesiribacter sp. SM1]